ncbi:MAG: hypothetical protein MZV65_42825 [Chromatiales bacterium]|nr:hypothetical protein [Chromatiales bacterium]
MALASVAVDVTGQRTEDGDSETLWVSLMAFGHQCEALLRAREGADGRRYRQADPRPATPARTAPNASPGRCSPSQSSPPRVRALVVVASVRMGMTVTAIRHRPGASHQPRTSMMRSHSEPDAEATNHDALMEAFEERAAILEFDAGLTRTEAELTRASRLWAGARSQPFPTQ